MKHGAMLMMEKPIHGLKKTQLAVEELSGDHRGLQNIMNVSVYKGDHNSKPSGKGERLIVLHAGGKDGWILGKHYFDALANAKIVIKGCDWVFKSKKGSSDYHEEMNATSFEEWLEQKLLPALPPNTLVMDNASYHR